MGYNGDLEKNGDLLGTQILKRVLKWGPIWEQWVYIFFLQDKSGKSHHFVKNEVFYIVDFHSAWSEFGHEGAFGYASIDPRQGCTLGCFKKRHFVLKKNKTSTPARNWGVPRKFISRRKC